MGRHKSHHVEEEEGELSLVPYLDMMISLVMFLIFSYQTVIEMSQIRSDAPGVGGSDASTASTPLEPPKWKPTLMVTDTGYQLMSDDPTVQKVEIPMVAGKYDTRQLVIKLKEWQKAYALPGDLIITAFPDIQYNHIVLAMDSAREDGGKPFFPNVAFAVPYGVGAQ